VVRLSVGPSIRLGEIDLVWPYPKDLRKVQFVLRDEQEC